MKGGEGVSCSTHSPLDPEQPVGNVLLLRTAAFDAGFVLNRKSWSKSFLDPRTRCSPSCSYSYSNSISHSSSRLPKAEQPAGIDPFIRSALVSYAVKPGDTLEAIGKAFKVPHSLLENINGQERIRGPNHGGPAGDRGEGKGRGRAAGNPGDGPGA